MDKRVEASRRSLYLRPAEFYHPSYVRVEFDRSVRVLHPAPCVLEFRLHLNHLPCILGILTNESVIVKGR